VDLNPLNQIDPVVIVVVVAIFWVTYFGLRALYFLPYIKVMEAREVRLEAAAELVLEAERIVEEADAEITRKTMEARERADALLRDAHDDVAREKRERLAAAGDEIGHFLEDGRAAISSAREHELMELRDEALECVGLACEKLVGEADESVIEAAVDKLIARRVH